MYLPEELEGLQPLRLGEIAMQLCAGSKATQPKQQVHAVCCLLGGKEDDGGPSRKGSGCQR